VAGSSDGVITMYYDPEISFRGVKMSLAKQTKKHVDDYETARYVAAEQAVRCDPAHSNATGVLLDRSLRPMQVTKKFPSASDGRKKGHAKTRCSLASQTYQHKAPDTTDALEVRHSNN
jgi:hypothetical protein